jgi:hypothetical protein
MMTDGEPGQRLSWHTIRTVVTSSALVSLIFIAIIILIFSIFVFGDHGSHANTNVAELLGTIGIGVLAALVTTVVDRSVSARDLESRITRNFRDAAGVAESLSDLGVVRAYPRLDFGAIFRAAHRGETVSWLDTYCPRQNEFVDDVIGALQRGVSVRMLVIDPASDNAHYRDQELEGTVDTGAGWRGGLDTFIGKMAAIADRHYGKFEIRLYQDLPCVPMYLVGRAPRARRGYFSIFLIRTTAQCQHLELQGGEWLADMAKYFEAKWARQSPASVQPQSS